MLRIFSGTLLLFFVMLSPLGATHVGRIPGQDGERLKGLQVWLLKDLTLLALLAATADKIILHNFQ